MKAFREFDEAVSNASFAGALAEWRNSGSTTKTGRQFICVFFKSSKLTLRC
jgi:hypothetical protein